MTHCERVLRLLSDGKPHSHHELYALHCVAHSRIADLRRKGHTIRAWRDGDDYMYQLEPTIINGVNVSDLVVAHAVTVPDDEYVPAPLFTERRTEHMTSDTLAANTLADCLSRISTAAEELAKCLADAIMDADRHPTERETLALDAMIRTMGDTSARIHEMTR